MRRFLSICIVISICSVCIACGQEKEEPKMMISENDTVMVSEDDMETLKADEEIAENDTATSKTDEESKESEKDFCSINDFEDFHYYLLCNTNIGTTAGVNPTVNAFIGNDVETMEAGIELYQKFMGPLWANECVEDMELYYISPDGKLAVTNEKVTGVGIIWRVFEEEEKKQHEVKDIFAYDPFYIIKSRDAYAVIDGETFYKNVDSLKDKTGYYCVKFNEQGDLAAGDRHNRLNDK